MKLNEEILAISITLIFTLLFNALIRVSINKDVKSILKQDEEFEDTTGLCPPALKKEQKSKETKEEYLTNISRAIKQAKAEKYRRGPTQKSHPGESGRQKLR